MKLINVVWLLFYVFLFYCIGEIAIISTTLAIKSFPFIDDFCYAVNYDARGAWHFFIETYVTWSGRFFSNLLFLLNPVHFMSLPGFRLLGVVQILLLPLFFYFPIRTMKHNNILALCFLTCISFYYNLEIYVSLVNFTNAISYSIGLWLFAIYYWLERLNRSKISSVLAYICLFSIAGTAEQNVMLVLAYFALLIVWKKIHQESYKREAYQFLFVSLVFLCTDFLSGNHFQFGQRGFLKNIMQIDQLPHLMLSAAYSFSFHFIPLQLISIFLGGYCIGSRANPLNDGKRWWEYLVFMVISLFVFFGLVTALTLAQGYMISARQYYPILFCLQLAFFCISIHLGKNSQGRGRQFLAKYCPVILMLLLGFNMFNPLWGANRSVYFDGTIDAYSSALEDLQKNYYEKKIDRIPVPLEYVGSFIYPHAGYMWESVGKRADFCSGRLYDMPSIEFYIKPTGE